MINVLIFNGYGMHCMPKKVRQLLINENLSFPYNRIISDEKLEEIREKAGPCLDNSRDVNFFEQCKNSENGIIRFSIDQFYFCDYNTNTLCPFMIGEVDTSRPWTIENYDGGEYVQYLDYVVLHEDINYCEYKD